MTELPSQLPETPAEIHFTISQTATTNLGALVEGNGLRAEQVRLARHDTIVHQVSCSLTVKMKPDIAKTQIKGRHPQGQVLDSHATVLSHSEGDIKAFIGGRETQQEIQQTLGRLPAQGFGIDPLTFALHTAKKEYSVIDKCIKCNGATFMACSVCHTTGFTPCASCNGQGAAPCQTCSGSGQYRQNDGNTISCARCQGSGRFQCATCHGHKELTCTICQGHGKTACTECDQSGFLTNVYQVGYKAECLFALDREKTPLEVQQVVDKLGVKQLATEGHAEIFRLLQEIRESYIFIPFIALLPIAQAEFSLEGKICPAIVAGLQGRIMQIDPVLDPLVKPGILALQKLSKGSMASQALIDNACKYRFIRDVIGGLAHHPKKFVYQKLVRDYPLVLSVKYANAAIHHANTALLSLGTGPRNKGLAAGTFLGTLLAAGYYMTPVRGHILLMMQQKGLGQHILLLDIVIWLVSWAIAVYTIKYVAAEGFKKLLPGNIRTDDHGLPTSGNQGIWALLTTLGICVAVAASSTAKPFWILLILK